MGHVARLEVPATLVQEVIAALQDRAESITTISRIEGSSPQMRTLRLRKAADLYDLADTLTREETVGVES